MPEEEEFHLLEATFRLALDSRRRKRKVLMRSTRTRPQVHLLSKKRRSAYSLRRRKWNKSEKRSSRHGKQHKDNKCNEIENEIAQEVISSTWSGSKIMKI